MKPTLHQLNKQRPSVAGTGLVAMDIVINRDSQSPPQYFAGGTCGNVLTILSFLGWDSYPITRMNATLPSRWVRQDLERWGVHSDFLGTEPTGEVPVIIEWISLDRQGRRSHRYSFTCPDCGAWYPSYKPVYAAAVATLLPRLGCPRVFFFDRVSRASILLAEHCRENGSLIVFEPSGTGDPRLFREALSVTHVLKYSSDRASAVAECRASHSVLLEIESLGHDGLRFRSELASRATDGWQYLEAYSVLEFKDAAGAGDWLTATVVDRLGRSGAKGFMKTDADSLHSALRFGQAAAAWNCGFEAPRGGMYSVDSHAFVQQVAAIMAGEDGRAHGAQPDRRKHRASMTPGICPVCRKSGRKKPNARRGTAAKGRVIRTTKSSRAYK